MNAARIAYDKDIIHNKIAARAIGVAFFALATALGAYVRIPVPGSPVPITLQTFFVLLAGAVLGARLGAASQIGYILLGALGIQVFQGAGFGVSSLLGPTGGYLAGFVTAAFAVGAIFRSTRPGLTVSVLVFSAGSAIILICGAAWLTIAYKMSPVNAFSIGILPFIPGDVTKILLAAMIYRGISRRAGSIFSK